MSLKQLDDSDKFLSSLLVLSTIADPGRVVDLRFFTLLQKVEPVGQRRPRGRPRKWVSSRPHHTILISNYVMTPPSNL